MPKLLWLTAHDAAFAPVFHDYFLPGWKAHGHGATFELDVKVHEQPFGSYGTEQYNESYAAELQRIRAKLAERMFQPVVWTDADLQFFRSTTEDILQLSVQHELCSNLDRLFEPATESEPELRRVACTAFQFFIVTPRLLEFYDAWVEATLRPPAGALEAGWQSPQDSYNYCLRRFDDFRFFELDPAAYWTVGFGPPRMTKPWTPDDPLPDVPARIKVHHANFTIGAANKLTLLQRVRQAVEKRIL